MEFVMELGVGTNWSIFCSKMATQSLPLISKVQAQILLLQTQFNPLRSTTNLMDFLAQLPSSEKIVLVGHSFGGVSLAYASEVFPEKIAVAVYVTAAMHRGGDRLQEEFKLLQLDEEIKKQLIHKFGDGPEQPPTSLVTPTTLQKYLFYGTSPSADATLASLCLRPAPLNSIVNNGLRTSDEKYGTVPRVYIKTEKDNVFKPETQEALIEGNPPKEVHSLDCDHSPFFSLPDELHHLLSDIATRFNKTSI